MVSELAQYIATLGCSIFAGAAVYINLAEHPARMECGTELALAVFGPSYRRAARMQAGLAIISTFAAIVAWGFGGSDAWLLAAALIFAVVPFTLLVIMPTNNKLLAKDSGQSAENTKTLLNKWAKLHGVRSILGILASLVCLYLLGAT